MGTLSIRFHQIGVILARTSAIGLEAPNPRPALTRPGSRCRLLLRQGWHAFSASFTPRSTEPWLNLLADGIVGRMSHGTAQMPSSQSYYLTRQRGCGVARLRELLGLRASLSCVLGVPGVAGRSLTLPTRHMLVATRVGHNAH